MFISKFRKNYSNKQAPEEDRRAACAKRCDSNNKNTDIRPTINDLNYDNS